MRKYLIVTYNTFSEILTYRLNFALWRIRTVLGFLTVYFLWSSVLPENSRLFGYSHTQILTYLLLGQLVTSIVLSTKTHEIAENINSGDLSVFLIKPFGYFKYWFFRDFGDKLMNIVFSVTEITIFIVLIKPAIFIQTNIFYLSLFILSLCLAVILHFFISSILSLTGFWSNEVWAPRFIFYILITFFTGGIFPLDILPEPVYRIFMLLPFAYLQYFPIKIYLGSLGFSEIFQGILISGGWTLIFFWLTNLIFKAGLRSYTAVGR